MRLRPQIGYLALTDVVLTDVKNDPTLCFVWVKKNVFSLLSAFVEIYELYANFHIPRW